MNKADEMFEELGYAMDNCSFVKNECGDGYDDDKSISFCKENKTYQGWHDYEPQDITIKEHLAIHKKMKELGWIK